MGVDIQTYRAKIGTYRRSNGVDVVTVVLVVNFSRGLKAIGSVLFIGLLLVMAGIEKNPGPREQDLASQQSDEILSTSDIPTNDKVPEEVLETLPTPTKIQLSGLPDIINQELLEIFFEKEEKHGGGKVKEVKVCGTNSAIIEFEETTAVDFIMQNLPLSILGTEVHVKVIETKLTENKPPKTIKVTGLPKGITDDILTLLFESENRQGGGKVVDVTIDRDRNFAIVEFEEATAVDKVMGKRPIKLLGAEVNVEVFVSVEKNENIQPTKLRVRGLLPNMTSDVLTLLFENENRQGGGRVKEVSLDALGNSAVIEFEESKAVKVVMAKQPISIFGTNVEVEVIDDETNSQQPKLRTIKVSGLPKSTQEEMLRMFFENEKRQGGGKVTDVRIYEEEGSALVEFEKDQAVENVLEKRPITFFGCEVKVERYVPPMQILSEIESTKLLVTNIPGNVTEEVLVMIFENEKRQGGGNVKEVTMDKERRCAVVEFEEAKALDKVLEKRPIVIMGTEVNVDVFDGEYPQTTQNTMLVVSGLPRDMSVDFLTMFFENENRFGGGPVKHVEIKEDTNSAIIYFEEPEAVTIVMKKQPIILQGTEVHISTFVQEPETEPSKGTQLKVSGLPENISQEYLVMFFENEQRQGGGKVKSVEINEVQRSAVIEFEEEKAVDTVLQKRPIVIQNKEVVVDTVCMDGEYPQTTQNTMLVVSGLPRDMSVDFLTMFFENENRFGGGPVKHVEIKEDTNSAIIYFEEPEAVTIVMKKQPIIIQGTEVHISTFVQEPETEPSKGTQLKVSGLPENISQEYLVMFFENEQRQGGGKVKSVEINEVQRSAVIEFEEEKAVDKVLQKRPIVIQNKEVVVDTVCMDPPKECYKIRVSSLPSDVTKEYLLMFFENERRYGGGPVKHIETDQMNHSAVIEFEEQQAVFRVLEKKPIEIFGQTVIVDIFDEAEEPTVILVSGIPDDATEEFLVMFFENEKRQGGGNVKTVEINANRSLAIIEFETSDSLNKVLEKRPILISGKECEISVFNGSSTVEVRGHAADNPSENQLLQYFENTELSGGEHVQSIRVNKDTGFAIVSFLSHEVVKRVCERKHHRLNQRTLVVNTYVPTSTSSECKQIPQTEIIYSRDQAQDSSNSLSDEKTRTLSERKSLEGKLQDYDTAQATDAYSTGKIDGEHYKQADRKSVKDLVTDFSNGFTESPAQYSTIPQSIKINDRTSVEKDEREIPENQTNTSQVVGSTETPQTKVASPGVKNQTTAEKNPIPGKTPTSTHTEAAAVNQKSVTAEDKIQHHLDSQTSNQIQAEGIKVTAGKNIETEPDESEGKVFRRVLQQLGLANKYPGKISMRDVIAVDPNESIEHEKQHISLNDIPWLLLKRLICAHSESRDITVIDEESSEDSMDIDNTMSFVSEMPKDSQDVSPLDIFTVVFQCCDPLMKQIFFQKLYLCKIAVPFFYKHWETIEINRPILSVWPLRSLAIENKTVECKSELKSKEVDVLELPTKVLAFARLGRPRYSKSKLINSLLTSQGCKTFFNIDCPSGMTPRYLSNGQIEMFWLPTVGDKKDRFQEAMTFLNMRGDINEHFNADLLSFISKFVDAVIMIIDIETVLKQGKDVKNILLNFSSVILLIANPLRPEVVKTIQGFQSDVLASDPGIQLRILSTHKGTVEQNVVDMVSSICKHITNQLKANKTRSYQERLARANLDTIKTDEDDRTCQQGKMEAAKLIEQMKNDGDPRRWKHILTPVHSTFSQQLGKLMKERERERDFTEGDTIDRKIKTIRQTQTQSITKALKLFIDILTRNEKYHIILKFFLCWLHFHIEREKRQILPQLMYENRCAWQKLKVLKTKESQIPSDIEEQETIITGLEQKIDEASFSVQHFFREIGHINEAILELKEDSTNFGLPPMHQMADIMGRLVADGHQLELIDGESFYMPYLWTKNVLREVDRLIGSSKVMTLSVLGLQSSGKSTLLNTMFGSQFSTRTGRCTRGIHVQLIPTKTARFEGITSQFNYVLVADTEGLRSPELSHVQHEHDNELATVITGIGDITMLNIMGENTSEIRDILQVIVHAFLRLKMSNRKLDIRKSCAFIHQNVTDTSASENMISGLSKLMQTLDEMTKESAKSEGILEITTFNQVIEFDINSQVWYLKNLWQGNPPMARVNNEYSERVVDIKCKILQKALTMKDKSYKSLNDIVEQAYNLWKGVLNEDFVFSFRNSLEIRAYMEMERVVQDELWHLESFIRDEINKASQTCFANCNQKDNLQLVEEKNIDKLNEVLAEEKSKTEEVIKIHFEKNKYKDIIIQWKNSQNNRIDILCQKLEQIIKEQIEKSKVKRSVEILTVASQEKHEEELRKKSMEVANEYKGQELNKKQINLLFDDIWRSFITKVDTASSNSSRIRKEMRSVFETCLKHIFKNDHALLKEALVKSKHLTPIPNLKELKGSFHFTGIDEHDISFTWFQKGKNYLGITDTMNHVTIRVNQIFEAIDENIKLLCQVNDEITEMSVKRLLHGLDASIRAILTGDTKYNFKTPFYIKIYVHVGRQAHPVFETHNEHYFKTQGSAARLEQYRQQQKISFEAHLSSRQSEDIVAKLFSHVIESFADEWISQNLPNKITDELYSHLPQVKNRVIVEICTDLLEKDNFQNFIRYLQAPKEYARLWITEKANYHLFGRKSRAYASSASALLNLLFGTVEKCVRDVKNSHTGKPPLPIETWINSFQFFLKKSDISIPSESFRNVKKEIKHIENVEYLTNEILPNLIEARDNISAKFSQHGSGTVKWEHCNPVDRIIKKIWGCPEQCPFCGEPCAKDQDHTGSDHYSLQHRPSCCKGVRSTKSKLAFLESCEFDIQSDKTHKCNVFSYICNDITREECGKTHYYRDYKTYLPLWYITPTSSMHDTSKFWMWFVSTYKIELQKYYDYGVDNIPPSWDEITKMEAKESLQKTYVA